mgnify:CR=1 FL=1|jgi:hypothetical protein
MKKKFGFLRFIAGFYKVIGIILAVVSVLAAIGVLLSSILGGAVLEGFSGDLGMQGLTAVGGILGGILSAVVILIGGGLAAICQFAIGEAIMVFLAIEENTRATASLLTRQG